MIDDIIQQLRAAERAVYGDGFGYAGELKSAYKKAIRALETVQEKLASPPPPQEEKVQVALNPDCCGFGIDNVAGCTCRKVFDEKEREKREEKERLLQEFRALPPPVREPLPKFDMYDANDFLSQK